jgi:hypothetical protein
MFARWHLDWAKQWPQQSQQRTALLESAVLHAVAAYHCFLAEIAADEHKLPNQAHSTIASAAALAAGYSDFLPAAVRECANLEGQGGWLADLLQWAQAAARLDEELPAPVSPDLISSSGAASQAADCDGLDYCLVQLEQLIDRLRGDMLEY